MPSLLDDPLGPLDVAAWYAMRDCGLVARGGWRAYLDGAAGDLWGRLLGE